MKRWFLYPLMASLVTALLCVFINLPLGWSTLVAVIGLPIMGTFITFDDDLPGGWANPDGTAAPAWETLEFWSQLLAGLTVVSATFSIQVHFSTPLLPRLIALALVSATLSACLFYRAAHNARDRGAQYDG
ncbi:MAG: hypothetical protein J0H15_08595 [Xanthomonadales bacterium]|nr:hypothetical protein [Xanthomonadales bacterium]